MQINILDKNTVNLIIQEIESEQNLERKRNEWIAYQSTQGMLKEYVTARLQALFPKNFRKMRVSDVAVSQKVVDKLANSYCESPVRTIPGEDDNIMNELNSIYKEGKFNSAFQDFDEIFNLHRHGLYWVDYDYNESVFRTSALRPYEYDVVKNPNTNEVLAVILNYPDQDVTRRSMFASFETSASISDGVNQLIAESQYDSGTESKVFAIWTATNHVVVVVQKKVIKNNDGSTNVNYAVNYIDLPNNPQMINPIGKIPFVYKQNNSAVDYPTFNPITEQTINFNILYSDLLTAASMQGFGQAILKYPDNADVKEVEIGYMNAIKLPQSSEPDAKPTDFTYVNANPNLDGQQRTYLTYLKQVLSQHGITSNQAIAGDVESFASGLDRMIANADVNKIIQKNQNVYRDLEDEVFELVKVWQAALGEFMFNGIDDINIYYPRPTVQINESDIIKNVISLLDAGLITKQKALMKLNPNLNEEQANEELLEIDNEKKDLMTLLTLPPPSNTDTENPIE